MREQPSPLLLLLACATAWSMAIPPLLAQEADGRKPPDVAATPPEPTVTVEFRRAELGEVIKLLAAHGDARVVVDPDVKGEVTMRFSDVPWMKALDAVVKTSGYFCFQEDGGKTLRVVSQSKMQPSVETRVFHFRFIKPDEYYTTKIASGNMNPGTPPVDVIKPFTLLDALRSMLTRPPGQQAPATTGAGGVRTIGRLDYYKDGNCILVVDTKPVLDRMSQVIQEVDIAPYPVLLDVTLLTTSNDDLIQVFSMLSCPPDDGPVDRTASKFPFHVARAHGNSAPDAGSGTGLDASTVRAMLRLCREDTDTEFIQRPNVTVRPVVQGTRICFDTHFDKPSSDKDDNATMPGPGVLQVTWDQAAGAARDTREVYLIPHVVAETTRVLLTIIPSRQVPDKPSSVCEPIDGCPPMFPSAVVMHRLIEARQTIVIDGGQTTHPTPAAGEGRVEGISADHSFLLVTPHIVRGR